jgi:hypothetical protein
MLFVRWDPSQVGDFWTWTALDPDSKPLRFTAELAQRVEGRIQISTDKLAAYRWAIHVAWQEHGQGVDYGRIVKRYQVEPASWGRYSPPKVVGVEKDAVFGDPDMTQVSTSHVERQNLTMRMGMRRFTRLTNGFSKKVENLQAAVALHYAHYNFVRKHSTIKTTPAVAAGVAENELALRDLVARLD